jgi:hypothetical protein
MRFGIEVSHQSVDSIGLTGVVRIRANCRSGSYAANRLTNAGYDRPKRDDGIG